MDNSIKLVNNLFFEAVVGERDLRMYKSPVDYRLGMPGLIKLITKGTGEEPKIDEAYGFMAKNRNVVKILSRDEHGMNMLELHDDMASDAKALFVKLGLL